jgi:hypothetical protein
MNELFFLTPPGTKILFHQRFHKKFSDQPGGALMRRPSFAERMAWI